MPHLCGAFFVKWRCYIAKAPELLLSGTTYKGMEGAIGLIKRAFELIGEPLAPRPVPQALPGFYLCLDLGESAVFMRFLML